jgi:hypothetical protein
MSNVSNEVCLPRASRRKQVRMSIKPLAGLLILALLMPLAPARADDVEDEYLQIRYVIQQGDDLNASGKAEPAKAKYQEALRALVAFQKANPDWNKKIVTSRIKSLSEKVTAVVEKPAGGGATTNAAAATAAVPTSARQVKLLEAGAEPRTALRLHPAPDDKQTLTMTLKMAQGNMKLTLDSTVKQVADNGSITYLLVVSDLDMSEKPGMAPGAAETVKGMLSAVKGMSGTGTVSSQGVSMGFKMQAASGTNPMLNLLADQMQGLLSELVLPLPEEAVGVGAKWQVKAPIKSQGITIDQTVTYELASLEGERLTLKDTTIQNAANQKIQNPVMPAIKIDLTKLTGKGTAENTVDLTHLLPISGSGKMHKETIGTMNMAGQKQSMNSKEDVDFQLEAK